MDTAIETPAPPAVTPAIVQKERHRIVIVEDDFLIGMLLTDMLEMLGHEVCANESTEAGAVAAEAKWRPSLMIVDAQLREGSGLSAVEKILRDRAIPIIFVTGDVYSVLKARPQAVVVEKPFTESCLISALQRASADTRPCTLSDARR